uniref:Uncharacterized protein n=1 Tax=Sphaerodactylus townsendi TaxID=933632 RepID=A0ACB8GCH5_9SAUR
MERTLKIDGNEAWEIFGDVIGKQMYSLYLHCETKVYMHKLLIPKTAALTISTCQRPNASVHTDICMLIIMPDYLHLESSLLSLFENKGLYFYYVLYQPTRNTFVQICLIEFCAGNSIYKYEQAQFRLGLCCMGRKRFI